MDWRAAGLTLGIYLAHGRTLGWGHLDTALRWVADTFDDHTTQTGAISSAIARRLHRAWLHAWHRWERADGAHRRRCLLRAEHCGYRLTGDNYHRPGGKY